MGSIIINIHVSGKLINQSSVDIGGYDMFQYAKRLSKGIKDYYGINKGGMQVNVTMDIQGVTSGEFLSKPLKESDHAFYLRDDGKIPNIGSKKYKYHYTGTLGVADFFQNAIYLSTDLLKSLPPDDNSNGHRGRDNNGRPTLERVGAHELGHSAGLEHPKEDSLPGNLMHQSRNRNSGTKVTKEQILEILKYYEEGELNQGQQIY